MSEPNKVQIGEHDGKPGEDKPPPAHHVRSHGSSHGGHPAPEKDESEVRWLISYSDFMMQLVCLFILLYSVSAVDPVKAAQVAMHYRAYKGLEAPAVADTPIGADQLDLSAQSLVGGRVGGADANRKFQVQNTAGGWILEIRDAVFDPGSSAIRPEARAAIEEAAPLLRSRIGVVTITAHAGGTPADTMDGDALKLAHARSEAVMALLGRPGAVASGRLATDAAQTLRVRFQFRTKAHER